MEKIVEQYQINTDNINANIKILGGVGKNLSYALELVSITKPTAALLNEIRNRLVLEVKISTREILDPKVATQLKEKFRDNADKILTDLMPSLSKTIKDFLVGRLINEMVGFGEIEFLLNDPGIEEIVINSASENTRIYHKKHGWLETNLRVVNESQIQNYANMIARRVGRQITTLTPLLDAHLITGDRANAVLYPISNKGHTITIRKFARDPWTVTDFIKNKTVNSEILALIWLAMQYEMNILVSGGTASGKTSALNVFMPFIPPNHRIISIEDTRELSLPTFLYWAPLTTREPNPEGKGEITMLDLLVNSLRMRPDRIVLGEIRRKRDAEVLFESMHTGHSVYATVHANSLNETIQRLISPPIEVAENLLQAVNLNVVMFRDRRRGIRRIYQLGEFLVSEESGGITTIRPHLVYRWKPNTDEIVQHAPAVRLFEELSRHTGLSQSEIDKDLNAKKKILDWMVKYNVRDVESVGNVIKEYYLNPDYVISVINKNLRPEKLIST